MRILILGGDGYLGWPTAMHFSNKGHEVVVVDNFNKRRWEMEVGVRPLMPIETLHHRVKLWKEHTGKDIKMFVGDLVNHRFVYEVMRQFKPETIIHYGEQPSAPFSMIGINKAVETQTNNVVGNLNVLFAMKKECPDAHLVKLGTMGEYGTPNIDIEEGYITITTNGRSDTLPFPKLPGSFYHLSKVHDTHNIHFTCRIWGLRATDLNQGVVYGTQTDQTRLHPGLATSFHYDAVFGTALNRFCAQAIAGIPLTVYGKGGQTRGFLNIVDTLQCVELAVMHPAERGEFRVFNQFTEQFTIQELAEKVVAGAAALGITASIQSHPNPRVELEEHYFNAKNAKLIALGLKPNLLSDVLIKDVLVEIQKHKDHIDPETVHPSVKWNQGSTDIGTE